MAKFEQVDYTDFVTDYSIKSGELATETLLNLSPQRLKKELNNIYNIVSLLNGNDVIAWRNVEPYLVGEMCQNILIDDNVYRARRENTNKRPDLFPDDWEIVTNTDYTSTGDFNNYLAKDNIINYVPIDPFNPATKNYVDFALGSYLRSDETALNALKLNGQTVQNILSTSQTAPASVNLVKLVDDKVNDKLNISDFNATNIMNAVKGIDGLGSGLDADTLDGYDSSYFMVVSSTTDLNNLKRPGTYLTNPGVTGAPNNTSTFSILVTGNNTLCSQIATDVSLNKIYFRSYISGWSQWKEFSSSDSTIATATTWANPITLTLTGDATGSVSFNGGSNVSLNTIVLDDSHTHDARYYTQTQQNTQFLGINAKAVDSTLFNGLPDSFFIRSDIDQVCNGNYTWDGLNTFNSPLTLLSSLIIQGNLIVNGTTTTINSTELSVDDKNIELGKIATPTDDTANTGGIILKGSTDKTILWQKATGTWDFSHGIIAPTFTGTASNSGLLNNLDSTQFVRADIDATKSNKLTVFKNVGADPVFNTGQFELQCSDGGDVSMGFHRAGYTACQLRHESNGLILSGTSPTATADFTVMGKFIGQSTSSAYADLAEIYTCKEKLPVGTVITIPEDNTYQIAKCSKIDIPFGVVSNKPGFVLNSEVEGVEVALIGQTPVRVKGPIKKGQPLTILSDGVAIACDYKTPYHLIIGRALETNLKTEEKLVNCVVTSK